MFYIYYEDNGPLGICGQAMSITQPWKRLYKVAKYEDIRSFRCKIDAFTHRHKPEIKAIFTDNSKQAFEHGLEVIQLLPKEL